MCYHTTRVKTHNLLQVVNKREQYVVLSTVNNVVLHPVNNVVLPNVNNVVLHPVNNVVLPQGPRSIFIYLFIYLFFFFLGGGGGGLTVCVHSPFRPTMHVTTC